MGIFQSDLPPAGCPGCPFVSGKKPQYEYAVLQETMTLTGKMWGSGKLERFLNKWSGDGYRLHTIRMKDAGPGGVVEVTAIFERIL